MEKSVVDLRVIPLDLSKNKTMRECLLQLQIDSSEISALGPAGFGETRLRLSRNFWWTGVTKLWIFPEMNVAFCSAKAPGDRSFRGAKGDTH